MSPIDPTACRNNDMRSWIFDDRTLNVDAPSWKRHPWGDLVDPIAAQLAWWLPSSPNYAKPGNAPRLPLDLAIARIAGEIERAEPQHAEAAKEIRPPTTIDGARIVKVESNTITLDRALKGDEFKRLALDVPKRSGKTRYPPDGKERGRAFLLSKQRRQHRGAR